MRFLVTGAAGFIGFHLCKLLLDKGYKVVGLDNINSYYSQKLKYDRLKQLGIENIENEKVVNGDFTFYKLDLEDKEKLIKVFENEEIGLVCNLAAQAGVRYSLDNPNAYIDSNIVGFLNLLECMRSFKIPKLVYASSSSVYGLNKKTPFSTIDNVDHPISLYAATKKSNELMAFTYSHLFNIQTIGLRFFTVYGPWGRPDMAMYLFTDAIINQKPIKVFNNGELARDFTYIDDIIQGVYRTLINDLPEDRNYGIYNIGNGSPVKLMDFIDSLEKRLGMVAEKEFCPMQPGDVEITWADTSALEKDFGYKPNTPINIGVSKFVDWYLEYYKN